MLAQSIQPIQQFAYTTGKNATDAAMVIDAGHPRIGVARARLADRPTVLSDEPTAHLDTATATCLATDLRAVTVGRTALIVTHRPTEFPDLPTHAQRWRT
ncbi:hypothetical protein [Amycolatopsis sp. cmx-11-51]|uniref:hypothetical protein n=1 Tax=Amycolatopsis sp. cmx-11-51 TaxID=2785797 RepID=UPI0039E6B837